MKKRYISPTSQVVLLDMQQMLALSPGNGVDGNVRAQAKPNSHVSLMTLVPANTGILRRIINPCV